MEILRYFLQRFRSGRNLQRQVFTESDTYDFRSFDRGKNWYMVEPRDDDEVKIIGQVGELFPGFLEYLNSNCPEKITAYLKQEGMMIRFYGGTMAWLVD